MHLPCSTIDLFNFNARTMNYLSSGGPEKNESPYFFTNISLGYLLFVFPDSPICEGLLVRSIRIATFDISFDVFGLSLYMGLLFKCFNVEDVP